MIETIYIYVIIVTGIKYALDYFIEERTLMAAISIVLVILFWKTKVKNI